MGKAHSQVSVSLKGGNRQSHFAVKGLLPVGSYTGFLGYSPVCSFMSCKVGRSGFGGSVGSLFILLVPPMWAWDGSD